MRTSHAKILNGKVVTNAKFPEGTKLLVAPANTDIAMAREKELGPGAVIAFDYIDYFALLWNNDYSNKVVWVESADPLAEAERAGAVWIYTRGGTTLYSQVTTSPRWELVGPLEAEHFGSVWRRKR